MKNEKRKMKNGGAVLSGNLRFGFLGGVAAKTW
jgi:hypothetical protein